MPALRVLVLVDDSHAAVPEVSKTRGMSEYASKVLAGYREKVGGSVFLDTPVETMSREDLLGLIGWFCVERNRLVEDRDREFRMMALCRRAQKNP